MQGCHGAPQGPSPKPCQAADQLLHRWWEWQLALPAMTLLSLRYLVIRYFLSFPLLKSKCVSINVGIQHPSLVL